MKHGQKGRILPVMKPTIAIVIPCYNESKYVARLLDNIRCQTVLPDEIAFGNSMSTDNTLDVIKANKKGLPIVGVATDTHRTAGGSRNAGARLVSSDYIVFIDADTQIPANFIARLSTLLQKQPYGYVNPLFSTTGWHPFDHMMIWGFNLLMLSRLEQKRYVPGRGMLMCVRRELHEQIGGFDDNLAKENDVEYLERLRRINPTYTTMLWPLVKESNRRIKKQGRFISLLYLTPRNSWLGKRVVYPALEKRGHGKRYGIFDT